MHRDKWHVFLVVIILVNSQDIVIKKEKTAELFKDVEKKTFTPQFDTSSSVTSSYADYILPFEAKFYPFENEIKFIDINDLIRRKYHHTCRIGALTGGQIAKNFILGGTLDFTSTHHFKSKYLKNFYYYVLGNYDGGYCRVDSNNRTINHGYLDFLGGYDNGTVKISIPLLYKVDNYADSINNYLNRFKTGINVMVRSDKYWNPNIKIRLKTLNYNSKKDCIVSGSLDLSKKHNLRVLSWASKNQTIGIGGDVIYDYDVKNDCFIKCKIYDELRIGDKLIIAPKCVGNFDWGSDNRRINGIPLGLYPGIDINWKIIECLSFIINMNNGFIHSNYYDISKQFYLINNPENIKNISDKLNTDIGIQYVFNSQFKIYGGSELHWFNKVIIKNDNKKIKYSNSNSFMIDPFVQIDSNWFENKLIVNNRSKINIAIYGEHPVLEPLLSNKTTWIYKHSKKIELFGIFDVEYFNKVIDDNASKLNVKISSKFHYNINDWLCAFVDVNDILGIIPFGQKLDQFGQQRNIVFKAGIMLRE